MLPSRSLCASAVALLATLRHATAQVTTDCFPLNTTNCPADPAFGMDYNFVFNATPASGTWETTAGTVDYSSADGAQFTINQQGDSPTLRSQFYFFFGRVEIWMKAAPGTGIISSMMLLSDDLDEIDWEFMGGNTTHAETNYFGKGVQDFHNAIYYPVDGGVQDDYHNYTLDWTNTSLTFYIDGSSVRTLLPKDANNTLYYPQTPMRLSLGIWAGGDPTLPEGTRQWAGGDTDYSKGPFTMYVKSARITDYNQAKEYSYGDTTGSWESIKLVAGNSTAHDAITATPSPTLSDKWNALSPVAKTAVYASAGAAGAVLLGALVFYCIRQRRRGAQEARLAAQRMEDERLELERFRKAGVDPDSFTDAGATPEYSAKEMAREGLAGKDGYSVPATSPVLDEKRWDTAAAIGAGGAAAAGANGMHSPMPLLRDGAQSPRVQSPGPGPYAGAGYSPVSAGPMDSHGGMRSPVRTGSPAGMPPPSYSSYANGNPARSFTSPAAQMRVGSPGPQPGAGYGPVPRMASPGPAGMGQQQQGGPHRSFTNPGQGPYGGQQGGGYGGSRDYWR
ncbi:Concanavalin A-like lectin/glucanase [Pleurostoma richardsiae]|uniref:chitinase n=1 Tax=Pleurostoma richardsiae TaxID=41990 RepID=A0AA38R388_9PEZI|nr:Concanavalin A-like lectin/glucanase [Pleurostoma richardsiae]